MGQDRILQVNNLTKVFTNGGLFSHAKTTNAVNNISFNLNQGEIVGLLGPNGSGKTTTIYMLIGALKPTSGTISYFGTDFMHNRSEIMQYIGFASSSIQLPATLSVYQNLDIHARLYGLTTAQRRHQIETLLKTFGIWDMRFIKARHLSHGQAACVMLVKAFLNNPRLVFLDEATAPLDPEVAQEVRAFLAHQRVQHGISILLASHNMHEITQLCNRVLVLNEGSIVASDTPSTLAHQATKVRISLSVLSPEAVKDFLINHAYKAAVRDGLVQFYVEEENIAHVLQQLAHAGVVYSNISIEKPTLEDYFLTLKQKLMGREKQ